MRFATDRAWTPGDDGMAPSAAEGARVRPILLPLSRGSKASEAARIHRRTARFESHTK